MGSYRANRNENKEVLEKTQEEKNQGGNERAAKTAIKGGATAVGAFFGGAAGANIGSKVGDAINNSQLGQNLSQIGGQVLNKVNKTSPMGRQMQHGINQMNESGGFDSLDSGIDTIASQGKDGTPSGIAKNASSLKTNLGKKDMFSSFMGESKGSGSGSIMDMIPPSLKIKIYVGMFGVLFVILLFVIVFADPNEMNLGLTSDYKASATSPSDGTGVTMGDFIYYNQNDYGADAFNFGNSTIAQAGCGPTAMAMVLTRLGKPLTPIEAAKWALENNGVTRRKDGGPGEPAYVTGTTTGFLTRLATAHGVQNEHISTISEDTIKTNLSQGKLMVLLVGPGTFTSQNHFIVLRGLSEDGTQVKIADPLSSEKSNTLYSYDTLISEGKSLYSFWV